MAHVVERAPQAMQSLAATLLAGPTAQSLSAALGGAAGGGAAGPQVCTPICCCVFTGRLI